jgi:hypothetical protein
MNTLATHPELVAALAAGAVLMMMRLGLQTKVLMQKRPPHRCPSCGRWAADDVCQWCTRG